MLRRKKNDEFRIDAARRDFLKSGACAAMSSTTFLSTMLNLRLTSSALAAGPTIGTTGYKALVCIFLNGAIDGFQVLTPYGNAADDADYLAYAASRTNLALRRTDYDAPDATYGNILPITDAATGKRFGVHPRLPLLRGLYEQGRATFVANVGALVQPIANKTQYASSSFVKPIGLFSHSDLQRHWQSSVPTSRNHAKGWGGRMCNLLTDREAANANNVYSAVSTLGANVWQTGDATPGKIATTPYSISAQSSTSIGGSIRLDGYALPGSTEYTGLPIYDKAFSDMQNDFINHTYADLLEKSLSAARAGARDAAENFQNAISAVTLPTTLPGGGAVQAFDTSGLGAQLASVARTIMARDTLQQNRQIFMVQVGGWDHHANLLQNQNTMIPGIDRGIKAFHDFLVATNLIDSVTTFTISDFGRTISSNGIGSDHGWGNNMIVMGGALNTTGGNRIGEVIPKSNSVQPVFWIPHREVRIFLKHRLTFTTPSFVDGWESATTAIFRRFCRTSGISTHPMPAAIRWDSFAILDKGPVLPSLNPAFLGRYASAGSFLLTGMEVIANRFAKDPQTWS